MDGIYLEVGCYRGSSAGAVLSYARDNQDLCHKFVFTDVFDGFNYEAAQTSSDASWFGGHNVIEGLQGVKDRIYSYSKDCEFNIEVHQSNIIDDPLPLTAVKEGIRVANLDVDLYEATLAGLYKIAPHILLGGILVCEDPGHSPRLIGAKLAVYQFIQSKLGQRFRKIEFRSGQIFLIRFS